MKKSKVGIWHVCYKNKYDLSTREGQKKFFHYSNLLPRYHDECNHTNDIEFFQLQQFLEEVGFNEQLEKKS